MASYKQLYEETLEELNTANAIIKNLENEINILNEKINYLNSKIKNDLEQQKNKNKLKDVKFRNGYFYKGNKKFKTIQDVLKGI